MKAENYGILVLYVAMVFIIFGLNLPLPQDDLMRDIVAGSYNYDYANLYVYAPLMAKYNQYILFDMILHHLSLLTNRVITAHIIQLICMLFFITPCLIILNKLIKPSVDKPLWIAILLMLLLNNFTTLRFVLGRPEMFFSCWVLWGIVTKDTYIAKACWFLIGLVLIPFYWLAFFYVPAVFFAFNHRSTKLSFTILYIVLTAVFWQWYSHGQWLASVLDLKKMYLNRLAVVGENKTILIVLLSPITSMGFIFYVYLHRDKLNQLLKELKCFRMNHISVDLQNNLRTVFNWIFSNSLTTVFTLLLVFFCSINMIRYAAIISALFVFILAIEINRHDIKIPQLLRYAVLCLAIYLPMAVDNYRMIPKFTLPVNSIVLGTSQSNYYVPFYSPNIKIAPAMEIGANVQDIQIMMKSIDIDGSVSCTLLKKYHFDYLVERNLTQIPSCLKIYQIQKGWRAWRVIN